MTSGDVKNFEGNLTVSTTAEGGVGFLVIIDQEKGYGISINLACVEAYEYMRV
jgi:hypothetical protein